ncbi:MAG: cob(I)alamin adenosyltransferase, partial [Bacteroidia bacterium]
DLSFELPSIDLSDIELLEKEIDRLDKGLPRLKNFILPGGSIISAHTHLARCICRRAERRIVGLEEDKYALILQYLNRLSDYLFVLSREYLRLEGKAEIIWKKD